MSRILFLLFFLSIAFSSNAYWQQHTATTISVRLDDEQHILNGFEQIIYTNNSPDTLHFIYIHLWPNAYKNDRTKFCEQLVQQGKTDFYFSTEKQKGYIDSLQFSIENELVSYEYWQDNSDIARIQLPQALLPAQSITIETPFRVKLPEVFSRLGHNGQAYFISQWFPKIAVYDHKGWHPIPYLDQGEFYSEFGSYDVSISLPENYIVMATGNCETESERNRMDSLSKLAAPTDTFYQSSFPPSSKNYKTVRYTEDHIHDFAWFADKRWILRQDSISGDGNVGVTKIFTAFLPAHQKEWAKANEILKTTILSYGQSVGQYPYQTIKAVEGDMSAGGGMEYPTVTIIDKNVYSELASVLVHEAGHNWFYGMLASNERRYPWMDEGMNSFYERKTTAVIKDSKSPKSALSSLDDAIYYYLVSAGEDQPSSMGSEDFAPINYGADVYYKTASLLQWLEAYMGSSNFESGMKSYFSEWKFKHPYPEDFRKIMQKYTDKNLDWFFENALNTAVKVDFKIQKLTQQNDSLCVSVKNKSNFAAPVLVSVYHQDSLQKAQWIEPFAKDTTLKISGFKDWDKVSLSASFIDFKLANNEYRRNKLFHKGGLKLKPLLGFNRSERNNIFLAPALAYNSYNGFGVGILLHNISLPLSRFQFAMAPIFSFGSADVNGVAALSYSWFPRNVFKEIRFQTNFKSFAQGKTQLNIPDPLYARYLKIAPLVEFVFREKGMKGNVERKLLIKQYNINESYFDYRQDPADSLYRPVVITMQNTYALIRYEHKNRQTFHPFGYNAEMQMGKGFVKLGLEANARIDYDVKKKSLYVRAYAGKFFTTNTTTPQNRYWLNTGFSGVNDYLLDGTYLGRNKNDDLFSNQVSMQEGGFKIPTNKYASPLGRSDNWLMALNVKTDLPLGKLPLRIYADFATYADAKQINSSANAVSFCAGLELHLLEEVLSIYAPLLMSSDYNNYLSEMFPKNKLAKSISFSLNINHMNWLRSNQKLLRLIAP